MTSPKKENISSTVDQIEALIAEKRAPFSARGKHVADLDADIVRLSAKVDHYLANPNPESFAAARTAELELVATRSLRERIGTPDFDGELTAILDKSFVQAAPLFTKLADENTAFLLKCRDRAREFRITRAGSDEPNHLLDLQLAIYAREIEAAEKQNKSATAWIKFWAEGGTEPYWRFWTIYRALNPLRLRLYAETGEMPVPENYCAPSPAFVFPKRKPDAQLTPEPALA